MGIGRPNWDHLALALKNSRGQSLIQVLVSMAIMGILLAAITASQVNQSMENRALSERLAANDITRSVTDAISGAACSLMFTTAGNVLGSNVLVIPGSVSATNPYVIDLRSIPNSFGPPALALGQQASPLSSTLTILAAAGIQMSVTSNSTANLQVNFDQTKLVRPIHNLSFPLTLATTGSTITGCVTSQSASSMCATLGGSWQALSSQCNFQNSSTCASLGGTMSGSQCVLPSSCNVQPVRCSRSCLQYSTVTNRDVSFPSTCICTSGGWTAVCIPP